MMKNVGIMTMHRVENYGSFLQAFGLKSTIEAYDSTVQFVDFHPGKALIPEKQVVDKNNSILKKLRGPHVIDQEILFGNYQNEGRFKEKYAKEILPILGVSDAKNYSPNLDTLVIGSDEVFNCLHPDDKVGYSKDLFGGNADASKVISYAASFGNTTIDGLRKYGIDTEIAEMLSKFSSISVRDKNSIQIVKELTGITPEYHLDPVLISNFDQYIPQEIPEENYILLYAYGGRISKDEAREILKLSRATKKKIICLCCPQLYFENYLAVQSPFEVLRYIKNADYIITDTFHGSVFSLKYNKKFTTFVRGGHESEYGNSEKITDLLSRLNLADRIAKKPSDIFSILPEEIDYTVTNKIIEEETEKSKLYLRGAL